MLADDPAGRRQPGRLTWTATPTAVSAQQHYATPTATRQPAWVQSKAWADSFWPAIQQVILTEALPRIARLTVAGPVDDQKRCTDFVLSVQVGRIACRVRSARYWRYADLTLRLSRPSGAETEVAKLRQGFVGHYLCAWGDDGELIAWALVDVAKMVPLLDRPRPVYTNRGDGVRWMAIPLSELAQARAITCAGGQAAGFVGN